jgi:DNA-binding transcriptional LysR family regulator
MDFTSRQLRAFLLVAQHRSFTRAAEALFITPSGLSLLIRELETQLGFRLFNRTTRHVALTSYGNDLLLVAQRNLEELDGAMSRIGRSATEASLSFSIGATPLTTANVLAQAIKEFRLHHPELSIRLFDTDPPTILQMVVSGKLDMGLGAFFEPTPGIRRIPLFHFCLMVIRSDNDPGFRPSSATWSALKGETLLSLPASRPFQQVINKHLAHAGVAWKPLNVLNNVDTQIAMAEAGVGIAIIPSFALPACRNRKVVPSRLVNPVVNLAFYQISNRGKKLPPGADEFTAFLGSYIAKWAGRAGVL